MRSTTAIIVSLAACVASAANDNVWKAPTASDSEYIPDTTRTELGRLGKVTNRSRQQSAAPAPC